MDEATIIDTVWHGYRGNMGMELLGHQGCGYSSALVLYFT